MNTCKICGIETTWIYNYKIIKQYNIDFFQCNNCGFMQTEEPYWLKQAYEETINYTDTGILERSLHFSRIMTVLLYIFYGKNKNYLDYSGGFGIFTRRMRDLGFQFFWHDPYTTNLLSKGFEYCDQKIEAITIFEAIEHFYNPLLEIEKILKISKNIFFSTQIIPSPTPKPEEWDYYGFEHGQHISFFTKKTFSIIAKKNNLNYYCLNNNLHLITETNINIYKLKFIQNRFIFKIMYYIIGFKLKTNTYSDYEQLKTSLNK